MFRPPLGGSATHMCMTQRYSLLPQGHYLNEFSFSAVCQSFCLSVVCISFYISPSIPRLNKDLKSSETTKKKKKSSDFALMFLGIYEQQILQPCC